MQEAKSEKRALTTRLTRLLPLLAALISVVAWPWWAATGATRPAAGGTGLGFNPFDPSASATAPSVAVRTSAGGRPSPRIPARLAVRTPYRPPWAPGPPPWHPGKPPWVPGPPSS